MVVLNKIYTRTGDDGTTGLSTGERRPKHDLRVASYGTVDEANATIGLARVSHRSRSGDGRARRNAGAHSERPLRSRRRSRTPDTGEDPGYEPLRIVEGQVARIEAEIDGLNRDLNPLRSFVLPGGSPAAAHLHLARTVSRRAERLMVELAARPGERVGAPALKYINRVSDFLFVASRWANDRGARDVLWVKGQNR